jgi:uncharacterized protein YqjF (DUF2071 family)
MLNFAIDPSVLQPLVPIGTELDSFRGVTYVSVVGFRFLDTRVFGVGFPLHRDFEEVNLRFYVRRRSAEDWRRGVVFVRELVPRRAIAFVARIFYGEPYSALPMRHSIDLSSSQIRTEYAWLRSGRWESLHVTGTGEPQSIESGSEEEFITEHYWGYTARTVGCSEYQVEHPRWRVWRGIEAGLDADISNLYGERFTETLSARPASAFIADGSPITVRKSDLLPGTPPNKRRNVEQTGGEKRGVDLHRDV